jgi:L,D-transpeptidase YbiS
MKAYTVLETNRPVPGVRVRFRLSKWLVWTLGFFALLASSAAGFWLYLIRDIPNAAALADWSDPFPEVDIASIDDKNVARQLARLQQRNARLQQELERLRPSDIHIVIDTAHNKLYLKQNDKVLREAVCSTGSGRILDDPHKKRQWIFDTPRGEFRVQGKISNPVWRKPDWAFIEEGQPVPRREEDRFENNVLGDYGLAFGDGFLIHGTLYTRLLGRSVTHGCVRMGDDDLEFVYKNTPLFAKIYIF